MSLPFRIQFKAGSIFILLLILINSILLYQVRFSSTIHSYGLKKKTSEIKAFGYPINKNNQTTIASLIILRDDTRNYL